ncbi:MULTISPECIES: hypothetical protein [unclassified Bradyrhizobium]|uniref:hypothetical protein n=1 Tax=unclassified Bradyrhizobium TaxID=2631580 RepID=UPI001FFAB43E|nr:MULTISPECIES: hypothetical protein [unclassified Bradyrhizobium]MCK1711616.1 hypothetical protein [Bradyrhizobium sp. 143]MCK1727946.1 hypothetical protein [Bradyrhizobium sp. 142]
MQSVDYYLRQAEVASRFALAESDPEKAQAMHILALEFFEKAEVAKTKRSLPPTKSPSAES